MNRIVCLIVLIASALWPSAAARAEERAPVAPTMRSYLSTVYAGEQSNGRNRTGAGALAGALGLEWPSCGPERSTTRDIRTRFSPGRTFFLLILSTHDMYRRIRCCSTWMIDANGRPFWQGDVPVDSEPVVSDSGVTAFILQGSPPSGDRPSPGPAIPEVTVRFIAPTGADLGHWSIPADSVSAPGCAGVEIKIAFPPHTNDLMVLETSWDEDTLVRTGRLRRIAPDGNELWARRLSNSAYYRAMDFSRDGSVIVIHESEPLENEICVFDRAGRLHARVRGRAAWPISRLLADSSDRYLYFYCSGGVCALDMASGDTVAIPPAEPLRALAKSRDEDVSVTARRFLDDLDVVERPK